MRKIKTLNKNSRRTYLLKALDKLGMSFRVPIFSSSVLSFALAILLAINWSSTGSAQVSPGFVRKDRTLEVDDLGIQNPVGLAYSSQSGGFHVLETHRPSQPALGYTDIVTITAVEDRKGSARIMASITDPINTTFDNFFNRLLIYQPNSQKLIQVDVLEDGVLDPHSLTRFDARHFGLLDPLGMAVDPTNGDLYILDSAVPQILHIKPAIDGSFEGAVISQVDLSQLGSTNLRTTGRIQRTFSYEYRQSPSNGLRPQCG
jgi:hypothetical protein